MAELTFFVCLHDHKQTMVIDITEETFVDAIYLYSLSLLE